ncbi:uncharacterized protein L969DRAFT_539193 [Mixia osmundae IAM 14324]|uniref:Defective in cullin neddylation protein n=1 Tax=Mixia osmundae (strain CBS 9802 / IAM 14324 / JCM 22182 / KY 12970) TaxID=764103 RepID=G7E7V8_MIXOS|nr:uncharacterized protein L969DRAFT_539193 [Mixia osmundae IAM 14324]KEI38519.1 hypothetical protein L969DRAFT_539193 [Mixia osmundae IAM 14324]GAA98918.1 hypothetical protein E5Q_05606 [Mixia osmundae IAM 14324]
MAPLTQKQKTAMTARLIDFTQATEIDAQRLLKNHKWVLDHAVDAFWSDPVAQANARKPADTATTNNLNKAFDSFAGQGIDLTDYDGTIEYCTKLEVDPTDPIMLAVAQLCSAPSMGTFERKGYLEGWKALGKETIAQQKAYIPSLRDEMSRDMHLYRRIYSFTFDYAKVEGGRVMALETAIELWQLLLPLAPAHFFEPHSMFRPLQGSTDMTQGLQAWTTYLTEKTKNRPISKDVWSQFLDFASICDAKCESYEDDGAWPGLIDDFVESSKAMDTA